MNATDSTSPPSPRLTIVGIGASAGGLAALKTFFTHVPADSGLAYVVVVHLAPDHESHLADLLQLSLKMPVQQVTKTISIEPDHVYVIPPGCNLDTIDTHLRLSELEAERRDRAPIDHFFRTLAQTHDGHAVGIILTGTGSDGTLGIREVKGQGGLTMVQDPNEAEYDGMPQSAIATGLIDLVLPLAEMPGHIIRYARTHPRVVVPTEEAELRNEERQLLQKIFAQVRVRTGRDFGRYKRSTILRRLQRRMQLAQLEDQGDYLKLLRENPDEVVALSDDFLITVTQFFRDREVFEQLQEETIPQLLADRPSDQPLRLWSAGCSTGEEAYSLAMLLLEATALHPTLPEIQIFASDLYEPALARAREGFYPGDIETEVSAERLRRFFVKQDGGYRIRKEVRELVVFAPHNLLSDPPFSRIDLILCRNLLIYLQRDTQRDVIDLFHYALRPGGYLLLGTSETIDGSDLFRTEHKKYCLFRRRNVPAPEPRLPVFPLVPARRAGSTEPKETEEGPVAYGALHQRVVEHFAPPSLLLSPDHRVMHLSERAGRYLAHPGGEVTNNVFKLLRAEFHLELRAALLATQDRQQVVHTKPVAVRIDGQTQQVALTVYPASALEQDGFVVVVFDDQTQAAPPPPDAPKSEPTPATEAAEYRPPAPELEAELEQTKQRLQAIIEEYETSQEEMKVANEEMQSTNEELRSTLEELETSKEELQSLNEELSTLNQENQHKVEELSQLSGDLQNLLAATHIATLFLDRELRIMRFTPQVGELFNVRLSDRGRPLTDLTHRLGSNDLPDDARQVLAKLVPLEREMQDEAGHWYLTRVLPYRSSDDRIEGVVITFVDITARRQSEEALRESEEQFRALIDTSAQMVWTTDARGQVDDDSPSWRAFTGQTYAEWQGAGWLEAVHPDDRDDVRAYWDRHVQSGTPMEKVFRLRHVDRSWRWTRMRAVPLLHPDGAVRGWVGMNTDITEQQQAEAALRQSEQRLRNVVEHIPAGVIIADANGSLVYGNREVERIFQAPFRASEKIDDYAAWPLFAVGADEPFPLEQMPMVRALRGGEVVLGELMRVRRPDGTFRTALVNAAPIYDGEQRPALGVAAFIDITELKQTEEALRQAKNEAERAGHAKEDFLAHMSHEIRTPLNAVVGLANLLEQQNPRPEQIENLQTLRFSAENLKMLVNDILDFSKIQAGKVLVEEMDIHLENLRRSLEKAHLPHARERGNELRFTVDEQLPPVLRTDSLKLSQVMNNLLSNAVKFTQQGVVTVTVTQQRAEGDTRWVTFSVQDTGVGIAPDKLSLIFETFTQADISTARQYGGTGLGLAITKLLLELMGSRVEVESEVDKGTRFFFTLPMRQGVAEGLLPHPAVASLQVQQQMRGRRVLLVEDVAVNRMMLIQFLQAWWSITPDEAVNGEQAVEMAREQHARGSAYDLILMDVRMPVMDGYAATQAIRNLPGDPYATTPILALTADSVAETQKHSETALFTDVITKPFDPAELRQKIIQSLAANQKAPPPPTRTNGASANPGLDGSSPREPNLQKITALFEDDQEKLTDFLERAADELVTLKQGVIRAAKQGDEKTLGQLIHKATVMLDLFDLAEVSSLLAQLLSRVTSANEEGPEATFKEELARLAQQIDEAVAMIRRATASTGKN